MVVAENLDEFLTEIPEHLQPRFREIVQITDRVCEERLDGEYREICRRLLACYCQPTTDIERGKAESWAAGIVYEAGQVNFLTDPNFEPYVKSNDLAKACGVSVATMHNKGKSVREALRLNRLDTDFCVPSRLEDNPLAWMMELPNRVIADIRHLPDEVRQKLNLADMLPDEPVQPLVSDWRNRKLGQPPATSSGLFFTMKITLKHSQPPIWRRVRIPDCLLADLHEVIQVAMGWTNCHLHEFIVGEQRFQPTPPGDMAGMWDMDFSTSTEEVALSDLVPTPTKSRFKMTYVYDFGDYWEHIIVIEKAEQLEDASIVPVCLDGARACPPEDCGSIWGYEKLLAAIKDPTHPEHAELMEWAGSIDPEAFDTAKVNQTFDRWKAVG